MGNRSIENLDVTQLDAVTAAPDHHRVIFEDDHVRVLDTCIGPGETAPVHTHQWPSVVYTLETSEFIRFDATTGTTLDSRESAVPIPINAPVALPPLAPHSIRNVGETAMRAISIELKDKEEK
jgi:hypothetical protein